MKGKIKRRKENSLLFQITNIRLYIVFLIISLIIISISNFFTHNLLKILENICYSIIAATFMACLIDYNNLNQSIKEKEEFRKRYFADINHYLSVIIGHLLWLDENINNDSINWESSPQIFLTEIHLNYTNDKLPSQEISLNEAIEKLKKLSDRYSSKNLKNNEIDIIKVKKLFQTISYELNGLSGKLDKINNDKIILEVKDYAYINEIDEFLKNYYYGSTMISNNNYQGGVKLLIQSLKQIKHLGNYDDNIKISIDELLFNMEDLLDKQIQVTI